MKKLYKAFYDGNIPVDVIPAEADLSGYKVVLLPQLIITKPEFRAKAEAFVQNGGTLVLTYRNAVKDADNNIPFGEIVPVGYTGLTGVTVTETESLQDLNASLWKAREHSPAARLRRYLPGHVGSPGC